MTQWICALFGSLALGLKTAMAPCLLTMSLVAISFIGRHVRSPRRVLFSGLLYSLGMTGTYVALAALILTVGNATIFHGLQVRFHLLIGPALIVVGMMLLGWISFTLPGIDGEKLKPFMKQLGVWAAFPLGVAFALAFCPTSIALFLTMTSLAAERGGSIAMPVFFGLGASLPVIAFAGIVAFQMNRLGTFFNTLTMIDRYASIVTGSLFIVSGIWMTLRYVYRLF
ncbi:MAG TPA: cytochrome C biogenesis protein [Planctomycetaceae bacterium]|nr:cytochrome C biogenesis protein [Planctomycetaceae bacterium]